MKVVFHIINVTQNNKYPSRGIYLFLIYNNKTETLNYNKCITISINIYQKKMN